MDTTEKISVIIPTYNRANLIERSVRSVLDQTYDNLEVIVVDDGSIDDTQEVIGRIEDPRLLYKKLSSNQGVSNARNVGVSMATASLIAFQDSDDKWRKDKLEKQMEYRQAHPEYSMVYSSYLYHTKEQESYQVPSANIQGELEGDIFTSLLIRNTIGAPTMLMRKECFLQCGGFEPSYKSLEDWEFVLRFSKEYQVGFVREPLMDAYLSRNSVSSAAGAYYESRCRMIAKYKKELLETGLFDTVVADILKRAEEGNVLEMVIKILLMFLSKSY